MNFRFGVILASWLISFPVFSQFSDDFSDGDLSGWEGDVLHFIINGGQQLQLQAPGGSTSSWMHTSIAMEDSMVWELYFKLDFAPSTSNQLKIYLGVDDPDLGTATGYFLEIGASGDQDPLELKYLDQGISVPVATSAPGLAGTEPVEMSIRVIKKSNGLWECYRLGDVVPELLFTASHDLTPLTALTRFGFNCKYTDTRRDKFYFDNISVQPVIADITAPTWVSLQILDGQSLRLQFDEPLDPVSTMSSDHYHLFPGNTTPEVVTLNQNEITLRWAGSFVSQQEYTLQIEGINDPAGNTMLPDQKSFTYIQVDEAAPYELLITEIMADPSPVISLPDAEFLEIHNTTSKVFRLSDYVLQVGASERVLPDELAYEGEYIILCDADQVANLSAFGRVIGITNMPSLTNTGATLILKRIDDDLNLHEVIYTSSWYRDPGKSDGGWTLEMINPLHICSEEDNWSAANNLVGGTPGSINSQWSVTPDTEGPEFISLFNSSPSTILLHFNEKLDAILMENSLVYSIQPSIPISMALLSDPTTVELTFSQPLESGVIYQLLPFESFDCLGNPNMEGDTIRFGLVATPEEGDILINEILFNPVSGGSRFIEIINASQKFIDLNSLAIGRLTSSQQDIYPTGINEIIGPGDLAVFSPEPSDILFRYQVPQPEKLYEGLLPSWDDKTDNASILSGGIVLDSFTYQSSWHHPVIADQNGVSLERIQESGSSSSPSTWHSAASASGNGTPTGPNSQNLVPVAEEDSPFTLINKQFSPNDDGFKDFLALNFQLTTGDQIGSVWVYDLEGREINQLLSNESLGTTSTVQWDGRNSEGLLAEMGIYVLFVQLWDAMGNVSEYQKTCALVLR